MKKAAFSLPGLLMLLLLPVSSGAREIVFENPTLFGYRIHWCMPVGHECGKAVADNFCHVKGYAEAVDFAMAPDIGNRTPLRLLDTRLTCEKYFCDGFRYITCSSRPWRSPLEGIRLEVTPRRPAAGQPVTLRLSVPEYPGGLNIWWEVDGRIRSGKLSADRRTYTVVPASDRPVTIRAHVTDRRWNPLHQSEVMLHPGRAASAPAAASGGSTPAGSGGSRAGTIRVVRATYGGNCGAPAGNVTEHIAAACNGRADCRYRIDYTVIGDPVYGCRKDYVVTYRCGNSAEEYSASAGPEAGYGKTVHLHCEGAAPLSTAAGGPIHVLEATYGGNCGAQQGNATAHIRRACEGRTACRYHVSHEKLGDPVYGCRKDYIVRYRCGSAGPVREESLSPEAGVGNKHVNLHCGQTR